MAGGDTVQLPEPDMPVYDLRGTPVHAHSTDQFRAHREEYAAARVAAETAALHEKIAALENRLLHAGSDANDAERVVSFQKERAEIAERKCDELSAKLAGSEASDAESVAMYRNARDRAEALQRERDEARAEAERLRKDAERYRLLRSAPHHTFVTRCVGGATIPRFEGDALDRLTDAILANRGGDK
jgi:predicted RNase H-like nuclease (RuvC/YqgF family)